jgi:HEAT repeat protein
MRILKEALAPLASSEDAEVFTKAAPALAVIDPRRTCDRCIELLGNPDHDVRHFAAQTLLEMRHFPNARGAVLRWLPGETSLINAMMVAGNLGDAAAGILSGLVARCLDHESPAIRHFALDLLHQLDDSEANRLASRALADEPDPALRRQLQSIVTI